MGKVLLTVFYISVLEEKVLLAEADFPIDNSKIEKLNSPKKESMNKFTTPFKAISDHHEVCL